MDFTSYGLDEETSAKLQADYEKDISGLKSKNSELIDREKSLKSQFKEIEEQKLDALKEAEDAKVAAAEAAGDIEKYKQAVEERESSISTLKREFQEKENDRLISDSLNEFSKHISDDKAAQVYMRGEFKNSIEVIDGQVRPKDASMTMEALTDKFTKGEDYKSYIKANVGSGAGSAGSNGAGLGGKKFSEMTMTEKAILANQNPDQYAQLRGAN